MEGLIFCPNHPHRRIKSKGLCGSCYDKDLKVKNPEYKKRQVLNTNSWSLLNPQKVAQHKITRKLKEASDPNHKNNSRDRFLKYKYGISQQDYSLMLKHQNGVCAICSVSPLPGKYLHIDHCHSSGRIRGLLCHQCNWYLGVVESDEVNILVRLTMYGKCKLPWDYCVKR